jgi:hypothetical protein
MSGISNGKTLKKSERRVSRRESKEGGSQGGEDELSRRRKGIQRRHKESSKKSR